MPKGGVGVNAGYHTETILDAELVFETYEGGKTELFLLFFDALCIDGNLLCSRPYNKRLGVQ
jgi:mRNA capping enzyme, catalytic domain